MFFFEKKNQKTFVPGHCRLREGFAMGEKKWRNLGSLLLSNLNWLLVLGFFGVGFLFLHFPHRTGDTEKTAPQTAATLVGALWGSAALLLGAQINEQIRRRDEVKKNLQKAKNFSNILFAQFKNISINAELLARSIKYYIQNQDVETNSLNLEIIMQNSFLSHDFMYKNLSLLEKYIGGIIDFHQSIEVLHHDSMVFCRQSNSRIDVGIAYFILEDLDIVFQNAVALAESMWPNEQIKIRGKTENLVEFLQRNLESIKKLKEPKS